MNLAAKYYKQFIVNKQKQIDISTIDSYLDGLGDDEEKRKVKAALTDKFFGNYEV